MLQSGHFTETPMIRSIDSRISFPQYTHFFPVSEVGYAKRSIESYAGSVLRLQRFYNKPLEDISEEQLRLYWLCCQSEFGWSVATLRISYAGIRHFFTKTPVQSRNIFNEIKWKREQTLPTILSLEEVRKITYALPTVQSHAFYLTLYSMGLR
jgi:site-specific recombinase XerD